MKIPQTPAWCHSTHAQWCRCASLPCIYLLWSVSQIWFLLASKTSVSHLQTLWTFLRSCHGSMCPWLTPCLERNSDYFCAISSPRRRCRAASTLEVDCPRSPCIRGLEFDHEDISPDLQGEGCWWAQSLTSDAQCLHLKFLHNSLWWAFLKLNYLPVMPHVEHFLLTVGRTKFVVPLYRLLLANPAQQSLAKQIYQQARAGYHPLTQSQIDKAFAE